MRCRSVTRYVLTCRQVFVKTRESSVGSDFGVSQDEIPRSWKSTQPGHSFEEVFWRTGSRYDS